MELDTGPLVKKETIIVFSEANNITRHYEIECAEKQTPNHFAARDLPQKKIF